MYVGQKVVILVGRKLNPYHISIGTPMHIQFLEEVVVEIVAERNVPDEDGRRDDHTGFRAVAADGAEWGLHWDCYPSFAYYPSFEWRKIDANAARADARSGIVAHDAIFATNIAELYAFMKDGVPYVPQSPLIGRCDRHEEPKYYYMDDRKRIAVYGTACSSCHLTEIRSNRERPRAATRG